jgi:DNA-binding response OmpR family regulator
VLVRGEPAPDVLRVRAARAADVRAGRAFSRQELLRAIWGDSAYRDPRAIDVHVRHLREKLESRPGRPSLIVTVPGIGYRFQAS